MVSKYFFDGGPPMCPDREGDWENGVCNDHAMNK